MRTTDEIYSIQKYLFDKYAIRNETGRRQDSIVRPYFRIVEGAHVSQQNGSIGYGDLREWIIWYSGISETDVRSRIDNIAANLKSNRSINAFLKDFDFLTPAIVGYFQTGGTLSGTVQIAISGIKNSIETLVSSTQTIILTGTSNVVRVYIPKLPYMYSEFDAYNIYAINSGTLQLQANVPHSVARDLNQIYVLTGIITGAAPQISSAVPYHTIFINEIDTQMIEDDVEADLWDGRIGLSTRSNGLIRIDEEILMSELVYKLSFVNDTSVDISITISGLTPAVDSDSGRSVDASVDVAAS